MANKIHAIKFLNWLFLRIKPDDYDPTQPLEFEGGIGDYLPLSGGTLTGGVAFNEKGITSVPNIPVIANTAYNELSIGFYNSRGVFTSTFIFNIGGGYLRPYRSDQMNIGSQGYAFKKVYTNYLNNGADLIVPTEGGTLARLEDLSTTETNVSELGDQVQGIEERIPGHASTTNLLATMADAGKFTKSPTDSDASFCFSMGDLTICGGVVAFGNLGAGVASEMPADLPVNMAGDYFVLCTPTADSNFDHLVAEYGGRMNDMFMVSCDNMGNAQATNVKVAWVAFGKRSA